jgi:two-component system cell cycle sensor histidine kinase/response regulator CckA
MTADETLDIGIIKNRKAEKKLRESREKYSLLLELSNYGVLIVQTGKIREVNDLMARICGYTIEEVVDTDLGSFFQLDDIAALESLCAQSLRNQDAISVGEFILMCKNGHRLNVEITAGCFAYQGKPANLLIVRDISDRTDLERQLEKSRQLESIAALSGGIAHDYNNLLTTIIGNTSLAQTCLNPDDKAFRLLSQVLAASKTAKNLTRKLIFFSRGGAPDKIMSTTADLTRNAIEFALSGSNVKPEFFFPADLRPVDVDKTQIGQAIYHVVMNAREAMPEGGILTIQAENKVFANNFLNLKDGTYIHIAFSDRGSGIAKKDLSKIFQPYFSTKKADDNKGIGLGLSICQSIVKKHNGDVTVESTVGVGTTVHLYLPAADLKPQAVNPRKKKDNKLPVFGHGRILVMDDEKMIRELAGEILKHLGYEVELAQTGSEAVEFYRKAWESEKPHDAVILDLTVRGGMGGKTAMSKLLEINPAIKAIVSSGYSTDPGITDFRQYGFKAVMVKPYTVAELSDTLSQLLKTQS